MRRRTAAVLTTAWRVYKWPRVAHNVISHLSTLKALEPPRSAPVAPEPPRSAPVAPEPPRSAPVAPEPPRSAPVAPESPRSAPVAPEPPRSAPVAPEPPRSAPVAPEPPRSAPVAPEPPRSAPVAPEPPRSAPVAPESPRSAPVAPEPPRSAPVAPEPPRSAPVAPEPPRSAPVAPEPPRSAPVAPEPPRSAPVAPEPPRSAPVAPEPPRSAPVAPEPPRSAPVAPESPRSAPVAPEPPRSAPVAPEPPRSAPVAPEPPRSAPVAPEPPRSAPVAPEPPRSAPVAPEPPRSAPVAPEPPRSAPVAPEPPRSAPVAPEPPRSAPVAPEPPRSAPVAPEPPRSAPVAPEPPRSAPVAPEPPRSAPVAPEPPRSAPVAPEPPRSAPVAPESPRSAPVAPEPPRSAPVAPEPPRSAPVAPEPPRSAPVAPESPRSAPVAPEPPRSAPVAPEPPRSAPVAPEPPRSAPVAPEPPRSAPVAPEPPRSAPVAPESPRSAPVAPEPPRSAPVAPEPPRSAPVAPEPPRSAPVAPEPPRSAPVAPEPPRSAPVAPEPPRSAPVAPEPPRSAPVAPEPPRSAPVALEPPVRSFSSSLRERDGQRRRRNPGDFQKKGSNYEDRKQKFISSSGVLSVGSRRNAGAARSKGFSGAAVLEDVNNIKVVFSQRNSAPEAQRAQRSLGTPPVVPMTPPPPPSPPVVASVVQQPSWQDPVATVKATASKGKTLFSIAPPSEQVNDNVWAKSSVSYLDEEIERARSTRPLVCSPDIAGDVSQQLRLNVTSPKVGNETASSSPKENLKPLPEMESASLDLHEVPDSISEKASIPGTLVTGDKSSEPRVSQPVDLAEVVASESEAGHQGMTRRADVERRLASDCPCAAAMSEQDPRCPWTDSVPTSDESVAPLMVSYDDVNEHVATCVLQDTPASVMDVVRAMHEAITRIEHDNGGRAVAVTHVLLTSLPTIDFFRTKRGPLEFSPSERVELLRAKEHLFARIAGGSHLTFVAIAHGGNVEDFAAELFISCHHRVFIKPAETTLGFPSIRLGDFPASCTVRKLARLLGARVAAATMSHLHEYSAETLVHVGVVQTAGSVREVIPMLSGVRGMDRVKVFSCVLLFRVWLVHAARSVLPGLAQRATFSKMLYCSDPLAQSAIPNAQRNPLLDAWCRYCVAAIAEGKRMSASGSCVNTKGRRSSTAAMFEEVAYSSAAINSATVYSLRPRMRRREFSTLPRVGCLTFLADEMERWWTKTRALSSKERSGITILLDCSLGCLEATAKLLKDHQDAITETNVVLMGDEHVARQLMSTLHCSVVILVSPASQHSTSVLGTLREVRVFSDSSCSDDIRASVLSSVLLYLQQRDIPYVVCRSCCSKRLTAVLVAEACRLSLICDLERIERISEQMLGLVSGPFRLADRWGADAMLRMMDERDSAGSRGNPLSHDLLPAVGRRALQCMFNDGFSGSKAPRGGFYKYHGDGTIAGLNPEIQRCYLQRRLTDVELSDRLLAVVVNECCELLLAGHLSTATDANMLTIAALGFHESTGGALALADGIGIDALVEKMEELAEWHGPHLQPSPLLKCMAHSRVSFASVSEAIIQSART